MGSIFELIKDVLNCVKKRLFPRQVSLMGLVDNPIASSTMPSMTKWLTFFEKNWAVLQQSALYQPQSNPFFDNPEFAAADLRVLIVRLSPFRDVDRSTPHLFLSQSVRAALPGAFVDMAFFPPQHDRERLEAANVPLLVGTQSWRDARDFDLLLVSNSYTLELINLPYLLMKSGIPVLASERGAEYPPLILGGSNALATQSIVTAAGDCVADALFFGEGERELATLVKVFSAAPHLTKQAQLLQAADQAQGLWVANTKAEQSVEKAICVNPQVDDLLCDYPLLDSEEASTARLQINYGCPSFCSFCFEGYDRKPYRELTSADIIAAARHLKKSQGPLALDLYSFNFNTHQDILALLLDLNRLFERVGFKSQRVDLLASMPTLLDAEVIADKRSFTLGVEGISRRMRAFLHKSLEDAEVETVLRRLLRQKVREIKLFFILTGHESEEDLAEFRSFVRMLKSARQRLNAGVRVIFSFGLLVRMPFTPLRYDKLFLDESAWRKISGPVKSICETNGFEFRLATPWAEYATSQVLAIGGYWLLEPLLALAERGHTYDSVLSAGYWNALQNWMEEHGFWDETFLGSKPETYAFALDFVQQAISPDFLYKKYRHAMDGIDEGYCLGEVGSLGGRSAAQCLGCAACTDSTTRASILEHVMQHPGAAYLMDLTALMRSKWRLKPAYMRLRLPPEVAGRGVEWLNAYVLRSLLQAYPDWTDNLLSVQESLFSTKDNRSRYTGLYGETVFAVKAWDLTALATLTPGETFAGIEFLGCLDTFEPGAFQRMDVVLHLPSAHFPAAGQQLRKFLQDAYVPVNLRRDDKGYSFDISAKARKKKMLFAGHYRQDELVFEAHLSVSPKFDLLGYLRAGFEKDRWREARVEVVSVLF